MTPAACQAIGNRHTDAMPVVSAPRNVVVSSRGERERESERARDRVRECYNVTGAWLPGMSQSIVAAPTPSPQTARAVALGRAGGRYSRSTWCEQAGIPHLHAEEQPRGVGGGSLTPSPQGPHSPTPTHTREVLFTLRRRESLRSRKTSLVRI